MRVKIPQSIENLPDGPHKRDLIRKYVKGWRREKKLILKRKGFVKVKNFDVDRSFYTDPFLSIDRTKK